jgi:ubiquinone/menaquinone biosynthesis C-methylase UbiE
MLSGVGRHLASCPFSVNLRATAGHMKNNYDNIARYYDRLSRLVFSTTQKDAQTALLPYIPENSTVLIAGGGTGWILEEMASKCAPGLKIFYVEISANMIGLAKQRRYQPHQVTFINMAVEEFDLSQCSKGEGGNAVAHRFDVIMTPFLFDNFGAERIAPIFHHLHQLLQPGGRWLFTDFFYQERAPFWQKLLLNTMYTFFRVLCNVEAKHLSDILPLFNRHQYTRLCEEFYCRKFIRSAVYQKARA